MPTAHHSNPEATERRWQALDEYMRREVLGDEFVCGSYDLCRSSCAGAFYEGQLHHIGRHYDLSVSQSPFRIVVIGQEYGHSPAAVTRQDRSRMVVENTGLKKRFKAEAGYPARNPHMRGTTSLLRLLLGADVGADYAEEFTDLGGQRVHIFEAFALVNFLLCSAVDKPTTGRATGGARGKSTRTMQKNCSRHFRAAWSILEPTVAVAQGKGVRRWLERVMDHKQQVDSCIERVSIAGHTAYLATFAHPSVPSRDNWGLDARRPYLFDVVSPAARKIRDLVVKWNRDA